MARGKPGADSSLPLDVGTERESNPGFSAHSVKAVVKGLDWKGASVEIVYAGYTVRGQA